MDLKQNKNAVSYIRCSLGTERQKNSLDVQRETIKTFANENGYTLVREFCDEETGRNLTRTGLQAALAYAVTENCKILVYRCDRLSRNQAIWSLIENRLEDFRFVEFGTDQAANPFVLSVMFAVAANESRILATRIRKTMQYLKSQGRTFGNPRIRTTAIPAGLKVRQSNAADFNRRIQGIVADLKKSGYDTLTDQTARLNEMGLTTRRGSSWTPSSLYRVVHYKFAA